jgi:hypothetical protein
MDALDTLAEHFKRYIVEHAPDPEVRRLCLALLELDIARARLDR